MKMLLLLINIIFLGAQETAEFLLKEGSAAYLDPLSNSWKVLDKRQKLPIRSFLRMEKSADCDILYGDFLINLSDSQYVYVNDLFINNPKSVLAEISKIEALSLPVDSQAQNKKKIGLLYGSDNRFVLKENYQIPLLGYRLKSIRFLLASQNYASALLSLKRLMMRYPDLYREPGFYSNLTELYRFLKLDELIRQEERFLPQKTERN